MDMLTITCPSCGFSRQLPFGQVPAGERRVTCPRCKNAFSYSKPDAAPPPAEPFQPAVAAGQTEMKSPVAPPFDQGTADGPVPPPRPRRQRPAPPRGLMDIGTLFNESWKLFQRRFATLIGLYLLTVLAFLAPLAVTAGAVVLAGATKSWIALTIAVVIGSLAACYLGFRCFGGLLCAVADDQLAIADAFSGGGRFVFPLIWVCTIAGFVISGGFLLLMIPGIIFSVWFFFAQFVLINEDVRGMGALLKSREYVRGEWFNVALRLLLVWAVSLLPGMVPLVGPILTIFLFPYVIIFQYLLYRDLREVKGDVPYSCGTGDLLKWPAVALAGYVLVPAAILLLAGGAIMEKVRQLPLQGMTVTSVQSGSSTAEIDSGGYRVINFPDKGGAEAAATGQSSPVQAEGSAFPSQQATDKEPENIHFFIYAVNYTGTIRVNGTAIKELEGKTDTQYSINLGGTGFRYGENQIDLDFNELPSHQDSLLEVHIKVSRNTPARGKEVLGEWRMNEKGNGSKTYTFDIPQ